MWKVTRYIVKRAESGATVADPETFHDEASALRRGAWIGRRARARVYRVTGEPASDLWGAITLIVEFEGYAEQLPKRTADNVISLCDFRRVARC